MAKYIKETPRINVKFIDADTEDILFEIRDRNWSNVGELMSAGYADSIIKHELKGKVLPKKVLVLVVSELNLVE